MSSNEEATPDPLAESRARKLSRDAEAREREVRLAELRASRDRLRGPANGLLDLLLKGAEALDVHAVAEAAVTFAATAAAEGYCLWLAEYKAGDVDKQIATQLFSHAREGDSGKVVDYLRGMLQAERPGSILCEARFWIEDMLHACSDLKRRGPAVWIPEPPTINADAIELEAEPEPPCHSPAAPQGKLTFEPGGVCCGEHRLALTGKPLGVLRMLSGRRYAADVHELRAAVWEGNDRIGDGAIRDAIGRARKALRELLADAGVHVQDPIPRVDHGKNLAWKLSLSTPKSGADLTEI